LNGQSREIVVKDDSVQSSIVSKPKIDKGNTKHIGATMPGTILKVNCSKGDKVQKGDHLLITEAMKMETQAKPHLTVSLKKFMFVKKSQSKWMICLLNLNKMRGI